MAAFLNNCRFIPTAGGTTDWVYASTVGGCQSPALAGAVDGRKYKFIAISSDLTQWEITEGVYTAASGTFARTTVLYNSSGSGAAAGQSGAGAKISFTAAPNVAIVGVKEDLISVEEANAFTLAQKAQARANIDVLKRNYIVNGAMMVSQQNGTSSVVASNGGYTVDQWITDVSLTTGVVNFQQVASQTPGGSASRLRFTVTTAQASIGSGYFIARQPLEGIRIADLKQGTAGAKAMVLQFGVNAPAGAYTVQLASSDFVTVTNVPFTISGGQAGQDTVVTVNFAGFTSGTFPTGAVLGMHLSIILAAGAQSNFVGTASATFDLFDVGLYEGTAAPSFQVPDYASETALCQRYWVKVTSPQAYNFSAGTVQVSCVTPLPVVMRTTPTAAVATGTVQVATQNSVTSYQSSVASGAWYNPGTATANARI